MSIFDRLFRRTKALELSGTTDWHCHILPGVDDGIQDMDDALTVLAGYEAVGIERVWLTPHIMEDVPNTTAALRERFEELKAYYHGPVELHLASENMMDGLFAERLEADDLLPIGESGNTLLVETSYFNAPYNLFETLERIKSKGYYPLLAHPERYVYIDKLATYKRMRDMGVRFQLNIMSLCGHYGPMVKQKAKRLLECGYIDLAGSDLHRPEHLEIIKSMSLPKAQIEALKLIKDR